MEEISIEIFIRNIQLYRLGIGILDSYEKMIYEYLITHLSELPCFEDEKNTTWSSFGKTENKIVFKYNSNNQYIYLVDNLTWWFFSTIIHLSVIDTKSLLFWWFSLSLDLKLKGIRIECLEL